MTLHLYPFAPSALSLCVHPHARIAGRVVCQRAADVLAQYPTAEFVVNGPMFSDELGAANAALLARHLDAAAHVDYPSKRVGMGLTFSVVDGKGVVKAGADAAPGATLALQAWPTLVRFGDPVAVRSGQHVDRAALCALVDGRWAVALWHGTLDAFARSLAEMPEIADAGDLDGGNSTQLAHRDGTRLGFPRPDAVASLLVVRAEAP